MGLEEIFEDLQELVDYKQANDREAKDLKRSIAKRCREAHDLGASDRRISEQLGGVLSRTRIQQLRTSA